MAEQVHSPGTPTHWIARVDISQIEGTLKPSAYVARAYQYQKTHGGALPSWADKQPNGRWLFDEAYIHRDATHNRETIGISEAAKLLGATRRTIQTWIDEGIIATGEHEKGQPRTISRAKFMAMLPSLKQRLQTAPVVGYRTKHGLSVDNAVVEQLEHERVAREESRREARQNEQRKRTSTRRESQLKARLEKKATEKEAKLAATINRKLVAAEQSLSDIRKKKEMADRNVATQVEQKQSSAKSVKAIKAEYGRKLAKAEKKGRKRESQHRASIRKVERLTTRETGLATDIDALRDALDAQLHAYRRQSAQAIAAQLREARNEQLEASQAPPSPKVSDVSGDRVRKSAEAIAAQLNSARDQRVRETTQVKEAAHIAAGIAADMPDDDVGRIDGAILFNEIAEQRDIASDIRIKITRQFFSNKTVSRRDS
jgi:hypothetical protein